MMSKTTRNLSAIKWILFLAALFPFQFNVIGQAIKTSEGLFLKPVDYCTPFASELDNYKIKMELNYETNNEIYDLANTGKDYKIFQTTNIGEDLPFYSKIVYRMNNPVFAYAFSAPLSFQLWWDPFEQKTSPVLNTSYKFALLNFKFIRFYDDRKIKNISFKISPFNHESTHIGDELSVFKNSKGSVITRINVSYEYSEFNITLNDPNGSLKKNHSIRTGIKYRINGAAGLYSADLLNSDSIITPSKGPTTELYIQYDLIRDNGFLTRPKWANIFSVELRNQIRYRYDELQVADKQLFETGKGNQHQLSLNTYIGWKFKQTGITGLGVYLHGYAGLNPYGQFRNHRGFRSVGISFIWN